MEAAPGGLARIVVRGASLAAMGLVLSRLLTFAPTWPSPGWPHPRSSGATSGLGADRRRRRLRRVRAGRGADPAARRVEEAANSAFVAIVLAGLALAVAAAATAPLVGLVFGSHEVI